MSMSEQVPSELGVTGQAEAISNPLFHAEQQRIADKLQTLFADPSVPYSFSPVEAAYLLEARPTPFAAAGLRAMVFNATATNAIRQAISKECMSSSYRFDRKELQAINCQTELRAQHLRGIVDVLDISQQMATKITRDEDLCPLFWMRNNGISFDPVSERSYASGGWYGLDQVEIIKQKIEQFNAPAGLIGETNILNTLDMGSQAFVELCERLEIEGEMYRNPEVGHSEYHFKETDVLAILHQVISSRRTPLRA